MKPEKFGIKVMPKSDALILIKHFTGSGFADNEEMVLFTGIINIPEMEDEKNGVKWFKKHYECTKYPNWEKMGIIEKRGA